MVMTANMSTEFLNTILPSNNDLQVDGKVIIVTHYLPIKCTLLNGDLKMNETVDGANSEFHSSDYHLPLPTNVSDLATFSPEGKLKRFLWSYYLLLKDLYCHQLAKQTLLIWNLFVQMM